MWLPFFIYCTRMKLNLSPALGNVGQLLLGIVFMSFGICLISAVHLGTTPISSLPWALSEISGLTFGTTTFLCNVVFLCIQILLLRKEFSKLNFLQIPLVFLFSLCTDFWMWILSSIQLNNYWLLLALSLIGNAFLALGVAFEIRSKSIPLPGEGLVIAVSVVSRQPFYRIKIGNDVTMVVLAAILGWSFLHEIYGIREGTLISAFLVGILVKFISKFLDRIWPVKEYV